MALLDLEHVQVAAAMTPNPATLTPRDSLDAAARLFTTRHIGGCPVVDDHGAFVGFVTQFDLLGADRRKTVADVMARFVVSVKPDTRLLEAAKLLAADEIHRLVVLDGERLVGILTTMDVVRALAKVTR